MKKDYIVVLVEDLHHKFDLLVEAVHGIKEQLDKKADKTDIDHINTRLDMHEFGQKNLAIGQKNLVAGQRQLADGQEKMTNELRALNKRVGTLEVFKQAAEAAQKKPRVHTRTSRAHTQD